MSQQVTVDYQGVSIQVQAKCDTAVHSLCQIDKVLDRIHNTADKLETAKVKEYEAYLQKSKETIKEKIEAFKKTLENTKKLGLIQLIIINQIINNSLTLLIRFKLNQKN